MNAKILFKSVLLFGLLFSLMSCKNDDDDDNNNNNNNNNTSVSCEDLEILNFRITEIEPVNIEGEDFFFIRFLFDVRNNSTITADLDNISIQTYLSTDNILDDDDLESGGVQSLSKGDLIAGETTSDLGWQGTSIVLNDPLAIDGLYLIVDVNFGNVDNEANCDMLRISLVEYNPS